MLKFPSFFLTIKIGDAHGDVDGRALIAFTSFSISLSMATRWSPMGHDAQADGGQESHVSIS